MRRYLSWVFLGLLACDAQPTPGGERAAPESPPRAGPAGRPTPRVDGTQAALDGVPRLPAAAELPAGACPPGGRGCACEDDRCDDPIDECRGGLCLPGDCPGGSAGCPCLRGRCSAGLACTDGRCRDARGQPGQPCLPDGECVDDLSCVANLCVSCHPGTIGCRCTNQGSCAAGVCEADRCVPVVGPRSRPADAPCFQPCDGDIEIDGRSIACSSDRLIEGCVRQTLSCVQGACLAAGEEPRACETDGDCPDFQQCIDQRCGSVCRSDDECWRGTGCVRGTCRVPCAENRDCPSNTTCLVTDGQGHCQPQIAADAAISHPMGQLVAPRAPIRLESRRDGAVFVVRNASDQRQVVRVRKRAHTRHPAEGAAIRREATGAEPCAVGVECPLWWLEIGLEGTPERVAEFEVVVPPNGQFSLEVANGAGVEGRWTGQLEVSAPGLVPAIVELRFTRSLEGRWQGTMYAFAEFGTEGLDAWRAGPHGGRRPPFAAGSRDDTVLLGRVRNALVQTWGGFRRGRIGWAEFQAVLSATRTASWRFSAVQDACLDETGLRAPACYLFAESRSGVRLYSENASSTPVPEGVLELPVSMVLRAVGPRTLSGRVESHVTMHLAGDPAVDLRLDADSTDCSREVGGACLVFLAADSEPLTHADIGGRFVSDGGGCPRGFVTAETPWLVEGVRADAIDGENGATRVVCRSDSLPSGDPADAETNADLTRANPVPDGHPRRRTLRVVDGAIIDQTHLFVLFEEYFPSYMGDDPAGFRTYGYALLTRGDEPLDPTDEDADGVPDIFAGARAGAPPPDPLVDAAAPQCSDALVAAIPALRGAVEPNAAVRTLVEGIIDEDVECLRAADDRNQPCLSPGEHPHVYCGMRDIFDDGGAGLPCPAGSPVRYFTVRFADPDAVRNHSCHQSDERCADVLDRWIAAGQVEQVDPTYVCRNRDQVLCAQDRFRLVENRVFFAARHAEAVFAPLNESVASAFRYAVLFRARDGGQVGFAPSVCDDAGLTPYCYDPTQVDAVRERLDCLLSIWRDPSLYAALSPVEKARLNGTLGEQFASAQGFERLYAELLIMGADESITRAFAGRIELADGAGRAFEGTRFEPGGLALSGVAGAELANLYTAVQRYSAILDRFYAHTITLWNALSAGGDTRNFVTPQTVTHYFGRVVQAATKRARAHSAIAARYVDLGVPPLGRRVIERAYAGAWIESSVLTRLLQHVVQVVSAEDRDQIRRFVAEMQRGFQAALLDMRVAHQAARDGLGAFGFPPEFVPSVPVDTREGNAFEVAMELAQRRLLHAVDREQTALEQDRSHETSAAQFAQTLARIRAEYDQQLTEICGSFAVDFADGSERVFPAIAAFASLEPSLAEVGDPCGYVGQGTLHDAMAGSELAALEIRRVAQQMDTLRAEIRIELERVARQCGACLRNPACECALGTPGCDCHPLCPAQSVDDIARARVRRRGAEASSLHDDIRDNQLISEAIKAPLAPLGVATGAANCRTLIELPGFPVVPPIPDYTACVNAAIASTTFAVVAAGAEAATVILRTQVSDAQAELERRATDDRIWRLERACDIAELGASARVDTLALQLDVLALEGLQAELGARRTLSEIRALRNTASRLQIERAEAQQLATDRAAAFADPTARIYRDESMISADRAFTAAQRAAWRATLVFEQHTSQSYARRGDLYLSRTAEVGTESITNYLAGLSNAFVEFEELRGLPQTRVLVLSLRDDILRIPRFDAAGDPLSHQARTERLRARLAAPGMLDPSGAIAIPFETSLAQTSPVTFNHRIGTIEAEINASAGGDSVARLYLVQRGTSAVLDANAETRYLRLRPAMAVLNPYFSGARGVFAAEVYQNGSLRGRPLVATDWRLIINQRTELANQDLELGSLNDIRLFIKYSDYTEF